MTKQWKFLLALVAAFALMAAACGGGSEESSDGESTDAGDDTETTAEADGEEASDEDSEDMSDEDMSDEDSEDGGEAMADGSGTVVGLTFDLLGRGDQSFNDSAAAGIDQAKADFGITANEVTPTDASAQSSDLRLQAENSSLVIGVGFAFAEAAAEVAPEYPDVKFAIVDDSMINFDTGEPVSDNAAGLVFAEEQGSYLVGVAAGLKTTTNKVGFIGGVSGVGLIEKFEAGFTAGVKSVNPDAEVTVQYISEFPDFAGFEAPDQAKEIASAMYGEGADIIYAAAGLSGSGMFQAAADTTEATGTKVWGIGVDSDQYNTVDPAVQEYVLTSMLKRVDNAVYNITSDVINDSFTAGETRYDLAADGVGYSTSGGFVDDIVDQLEEAKAGIVDGTVTVPTAP